MSAIFRSFSRRFPKPNCKQGIEEQRWDKTSLVKESWAKRNTAVQQDHGAITSTAWIGTPRPKMLGRPVTPAKEWDAQILGSQANVRSLPGSGGEAS